MATTEDKDNIIDNRGSMGSMRIILGVMIVLIGFFATLASIFYFFHWKEDSSLLAGVASSRPDIELKYGNIGGGLGARIGDLLIGRSFGLVGVIIPIYLMIFGVNIMKGSKRFILNRDTLTMFIILILGSLTLGAVFGSSWSIFGSGLGGAFGVQIANMLYGSIGIGLILLLIGAWFAMGVFINSNFINVVNKAGSSALSRTDKFFACFKKREVPKEEREEREEPVEIATPNTQTINDVYATVPDPTIEVIPIEEETEEETEEEEDPFIEVLGKRTVEVIEPVEPDEDEAEESNGAVVFVEVNKAKELSESEIEQELYDPTLDIMNYSLPTPSLLEDYQTGVGVSDEEIFENKSQIEETLSHFGIPIQQNIKATVGPTITLYEIVQASGVKISKIQGLENDIAQNLKALGIRIIAPIPGKGTIGIELPNRRKQIVSMRSAIISPEFNELKAQLPIVIGRTIQNDNYVFDLAKMPHLLVAGATGQGKSVGLNAIITSLLYRKHPSELKFVMIDPKMVEFSPYKKLENHFMAKMESEEDVIITDPKKAVYTLNAICEEMESRLKLLSQAGVRNIVEYNEKFRKRLLLPDKGHFYMPYIVVIIDEFADLIMTAKEVEMPVMRIAQKARAIGIHLIVATQRPDVKVITGGIKANFPARIAFKVTQMIDSRTIIDQPGANQLIGRGDMLFSKDGDLTRIQCALVETDEVSRIVNHISSQPGYSAPYRLPDYAPDGGSGDFDGGESGAVIKYDALFAEIARTAVSNGGISTSAIQRNFEVGFNRAGRIMTQLERAGIVGRQEGSKPRDILFYDMPSLESKLQELGLF
ncbi:MAG: DNA translocase FtsK 4TM domain-containing protein [Rikenellaceae bacterium]